MSNAKWWSATWKKKAKAWRTQWRIHQFFEIRKLREALFEIIIQTDDECSRAVANNALHDTKSADVTEHVMKNLCNMPEVRVMRIQLSELTKERDKWKWEYENLCRFATDFELQRDEYRRALEKIANEDFRGNRPHGAVVAFEALSKFKKTKE